VDFFRWLAEAGEAADGNHVFEWLWLILRIAVMTGSPLGGQSCCLSNAQSDDHRKSRTDEICIFCGPAYRATSTGADD
jgi:hypothetical protein